ncbi:MAG: ROK family protein [Clostridiaceae bacterium]|nr:ROK family protein [Clostridiaceae bacterium]
MLLKDKSLDPTMPYTIRELFAAAYAGDPAAKYSVDLYSHYLAIGIASLIVILQPEIIALGGGISHQEESFYAGLQEAVADHLLAGACQPVPRIVPAKLGNDAGIVGAAISR